MTEGGLGYRPASVWRGGHRELTQRTGSGRPKFRLGFTSAIVGKNVDCAKRLASTYKMRVIAGGRYEGGSMQDNRSSERDAVAAAQDWLELIDEGDSSESYNKAASLFKSAISLEQWQNSLAAAQVSLGRPLSRSFKSSRYAEELPGAPDGKYYIIEYDTAFERKRNGTETVIPMLDEDGVWRVSGYFVK
jgi:hypothetical protein